MHRAEFEKPDGRKLWLFAREQIWTAQGPVPVPGGPAVVAQPHMRWNPFDGEWVIYAAHRQARPSTDPRSQDINPLAPTRDPMRPTELPNGNWQVAVFENRFPSLTAATDVVAPVQGALAAPAVGRAEVIVFGQDENTSLGLLGDDRIALVLEVIAERTLALAAEGVRYVLPFQNRGAEMGVTLSHPHGQIYGYGFVPARQARQSALLRAHLGRVGADLAGAVAHAEIEAGLRVIDRREEAVSFVPPFARFPYEIWVVPLVPARDLAELPPAALRDIAAVLGAALRRLEGLWQRPMPYLLTVNQRPFDNDDHAEWRVRIEIWPLLRASAKLKFLAGTELAAGVFASDVVPEPAAAALRAVAP